MSLFNLFRKKYKEEKTALPHFRLGHYSDYQKSEEQLRHWQEAMQAFETQQYESMFEHFFKYLADPNENNVSFNTTQNKTFSLLQGSKRLQGEIREKTLRAEVPIARAENMHIAFLRHMIQSNFRLKYGRYAINEKNELLLIFDSYIADCSPYKLYHGLKEIAVEADRQDDLFLQEFHMLKPLGSEHVTPFGESQKQHLSKWMKTWIEACFKEVEQPSIDIQKNPGALAFLLLNTAYRIDALLKPEGKLLDKIDEIHKNYFAKNDLTIEQKNQKSLDIFKEIYAQLEEIAERDFYKTRSTFAIANPFAPDEIKKHIRNEVPKMDWYIQNEKFTYAMAIANYIAGYVVYFYSPPDWLHEIFLLYFRITQSDFFRETGFPAKFFPNKKAHKPFAAPNKKKVERALDQIKKKYKNELKNTYFKKQMLQYQNLPAFAKSYLLMTARMESSKKR